MSKPRKQSPTPPQPSEAIAAPITRKIDLADVESIARLCALRLTEKDACAHLGINYEAWRNWKCLNKERTLAFNDAIARVKAAKLEAIVAVIDEAKDRTGAPDWRAKAWLAEKVFAHDSIGRSQQEQSVNVSGTVHHKVDVESSLKKIYGLTEPQQIIDAAEVKQLPETTEPAE
jgi:hypothetical protein